MGEDERRNYGFRPLAGDLSSLHLCNESPTNFLSFRPLAGDLSSLLTKAEMLEEFHNVSVPLQGTYLPYAIPKMSEFDKG